MNAIFQARPLAAAIALLCAASAFAQDLPVVTIRGAAGGEGLALDRQNTTGSRLDIRALDLPASAESLSAATIAARGDLLVKDAVTRTTGLTDSSSPGSGISYSARGFNGNNSIAMLENGQRLLVGSTTATYPADPWGYETIEVLRGPGSVVHGSGTTGAIINAVRKAPRRESSLEILGGIGGGESLRAGIGATGALGEQGAFRVDAYAGRSDGFIDRGESRHGKILTSMTTTLAPGVTMYAQLDHAEQEPIRYFGTPLVNGGLAERLRDENYNAGDAVLRFVDDKAVARLHWQVAPNLDISNELAYFKSRRDWRNIDRMPMIRCATWWTAATTSVSATTRSRPRTAWRRAGRPAPTRSWPAGKRRPSTSGTSITRPMAAHRRWRRPASTRAASGTRRTRSARTSRPTPPPMPSISRMPGAWTSACS